MFFQDLKPDHVLFAAFDAAGYLVLFLSLVAILRVSLRLLARDEADDSLTKCFVATLLILLVAGFAVVSVQAQTMGRFMLVPVVVISVLLLHLLCWVSFRKAVPIMLLFGGSFVGLALGLLYGLDQLLPHDRVTLSARIQTSLGLLQKMAGKESEPVFTKSNLKTIKTGWALNTEALKSAVVLLRDPEALDRMVAQHQEDLRALDLLVEGGTNSLEQLAEIGIVYAPDDPALRGVEVLQGAGEKKEVTEQDVQDVVVFLQSVRKGGAEVTPTDAAIVLRAAMKRAQTFQTNVVAGVRLGDLVAGTGSVAQASSAAVSGSVAAVTAVVLVSRQAEPATVDPFAGLGEAQRAGWKNSKTGLVVTAMVRYGQGQVLAKVNDQLVRLGGIVLSPSQGNFYAWRMVDVHQDEVLWEPVLTRAPAPATQGMTFRF